jgi:hypothetical protein
MKTFGKLAAIWLTLVAVSVIGRLWQPAYGVSPLTGVAIVAGTVFPNPLVAATVPLAGLGISNLVLPGYGTTTGGFALAAVVALAFASQVLLGRLARGHRGGLVLAALAGSLLFFLMTNFAFWLVFTDMYPRTAAGLVSCYVAALPFVRWAPLGDVVWTVVLGEIASRCGAVPGTAPVSSRSAAPA